MEEPAHRLPQRERPTATHLHPGPSPRPRRGRAGRLKAGPAPARRGNSTGPASSITATTARSTDDPPGRRTRPCTLVQAVQPPGGPAACRAPDGVLQRQRPHRHLHHHHRSGQPHITHHAVPVECQERSTHSTSAGVMCMLAVIPEIDTPAAWREAIRAATSGATTGLERGFRFARSARPALSGPAESTDESLLRGVAWHVKPSAEPPWPGRTTSASPSSAGRRLCGSKLSTARSPIAAPDAQLRPGVTSRAGCSTATLVSFIGCRRCW